MRREQQACYSGLGDNGVYLRTHFYHPATLSSPAGLLCSVRCSSMKTRNIVAASLTTVRAIPRMHVASSSVVKTYWCLINQHG